MRILYLDIDTLRPDHLACYGYHRQTSPHIDRIARQGVRFDHCHVSDAPCLPSRTSLCTGRFGIHNGVINHGGVAADPFLEGPGRGFTSLFGRSNWMRLLRNAGLRTVDVSPFAERHSAWWWYAGFAEMYNPGKGGMERAEEVTPTALDWIRRNARGDHWLLHVNLWDPHTPYRTPADFGDPFKDSPLPAWLTEEVRRQHWEGVGPHCAREIPGYDPGAPHMHGYPRQPNQAASMADVRRMFDGYDTGVLYADHHVGLVLNALADQGVLDDTALFITSDHGECLGELNIYGDHQVADQITSRVPLIVRWPGVTDGQQGRVDAGLHYQNDWAATVLELMGQAVPEHWDGVSFAQALQRGECGGRDGLVVSQGAWSCQRSVRWGDHLGIRSYHDGHHCFPDVMLFDVKRDPHEQHDLASERPDLVGQALGRLEEWHGRMMRTSATNVDPMWTVLREGGPLHTRGQLPKYLARLRATGRGHWADQLAARHPREC